MTVDRVRALVLKDLRLLRPVAIGFAGALLFVVAVLPLSTALFGGPDPMRPGSPYDWHRALVAVRNGVPLLWIVTMAAVTAVGGLAFAQERAERWAEFTAVLPVRRGTAVAVKLVCGVFACAAMIGLTLTVRKAAGGLSFQAMPISENAARLAAPGYDGDAAAVLRSLVAAQAALPVALFGVAWALSSVLRGVVWPTVTSIAVVGGLFVLLLSLCDIAAGQRTADVNDTAVFIQWCLAETGGAVGVIGIVSGCLVQAWRRSP